LHFALQSAREGIPDDRDLIDLRDSAYEIERSLNLLHDNMKNALDYRIAQRAEQQTQISLESVRMSNRLNILVAIFFPLTATSCVFGMNLNSGVSSSSILAFWFILMVSVSVGLFVRRWIVTGKI
jgi:Mg2+ and Co2+ transporter CorA